MRRIEDVVAETLGIDASQVSDQLAFNGIPQWDSLNHVNLMLAIERDYGIPIDEDRMVELISVEVIKAFVNKAQASL